VPPHTHHVHSQEPILLDLGFEGIPTCKRGQSLIVLTLTSLSGPTNFSYSHWADSPTLSGNNKKSEETRTSCTLDPLIKRPQSSDRIRCGLATPCQLQSTHQDCCSLAAESILSAQTLRANDWPPRRRDFSTALHEAGDPRSKLSEGNRDDPLPLLSSPATTSGVHYDVVSYTLRGVTTISICAANTESRRFVTNWEVIAAPRSTHICVTINMVYDRFPGVHRLPSHHWPRY